MLTTRTSLRGAIDALRGMLTEEDWREAMDASTACDGRAQQVTLEFMRFRFGLGVALVGLVVGSGCSPKHPDYIGDGPPPNTGIGGMSGTSSTGGTRSTENAAGEAGASASDGGAPSKVPVVPDITEFDPEQIYIFGTVAEGSGRYAICLVENPNLYLVGFSDVPDDNKLEILNGQMLYKNIGVSGIRAFGSDLQSSLKGVDLKYPEDAQRNDSLVVTPPCLAEDDGPINFFTSPDNRFIYECPDKIWYEDGEVVYDPQDSFDEITAMGYDGWTLVDGISPGIMNLSDGQRLTVDGLDVSTNIVAQRATKDGFHIVVTSKTGDDTPELWNISTAAIAERLGIYPLPPEGRNPHSWGELTTDDALYEIGSGPETFQDIIVRRTLDGSSEVVYDEITEPHVMLHGSAIFTGP